MALYQFEERKPRVAQGAFVADSRKKGSNVLFQLSVLFLLFLLRYHLQFPTLSESFSTGKTLPARLITKKIKKIFSHISQS